MPWFPYFADGFLLVSEEVEVERLDLGRQIDSITLPSAWEVRYRWKTKKSDKVVGTRKHLLYTNHSLKLCVYYIYTHEEKNISKHTLGISVATYLRCHSTPGHSSNARAAVRCDGHRSSWMSLCLRWPSDLVLRLDGKPPRPKVGSICLPYG